MANTRLYFPVQALYIQKSKTGLEYNFVHGVQSASDNADIATENINEFGQITVYEIVEGTPSITIDVERVLDGYPPLYLLATEGSVLASLNGRQDARADLAIAGYDSAANYVANNSVQTVEYSGTQVASVTYTFAVDGPFTESISFISDYREWAVGGAEKYGTFNADPTLGGTDEPLALTACSGGVQFKENMKFDGTFATLLPSQIPGVSSSGWVPITNNKPDVPVQSITVTADLGREEINQLGSRGPYNRFASFPIDVTLDIEVISRSGDGINISELGTFDGCDYFNAPNQRARICTDSGLVIDLGDRLKLTNISQTYGGTDGGSATITFSYVGQNVMSVFHDQDPSVIPYTGFWV